MGNTTWTPNTPSASPIDANAGYMMRGSITMSSSYVTGGDAVTAAEIGLGTLEDLFLAACTTSGYVLTYNSANGTVQAFWTGSALSGVLSEVTSGTNLAAVTGEAIAYGY